MDSKALLSGDDRSVGAHLLRALLTPLAYLHRIGLEVYLLPYQLGLRKRHRFPVPTIVIGNLTSGGTGKTPMAAWVGAALRAQGKRVVLLSRGHGGSHSQTAHATIVSRGDGRAPLAAELAGDEPALLARLLPDIPVVVGRDRRISGQLALREFAPDVLLLDDALQFWQLESDLRIVLLDTRRPFDNGYLLPRGLLREPPSHLTRAQVVVLTRADQATPEQRQFAEAAVRRYAPDALLLTACHRPQSWVTPTGEVLPLDSVSGTAAALSGIADGLAFETTLQTLGLSLIFHSRFGDHHAYNKTELDALLQRAPGERFLTTEKDLTKLASLWPSDGPPLLALRIGMEISPAGALEPVLRQPYGIAVETQPSPSETT